VALNSSFEAEGELYIDDGKSYNYKEGAFIHRRFTFSDGRISSSDLSPAKPGKKAYKSLCVIERIILLGLKRKDVTPHKVLIESVGSQVLAEPGSVLLRSGVPANALIVRMPKVPVAGDWSIKVL
jgi:alpha 1,3-glucosidase